MEPPELDLKHIHWSSPEWIYSLPTHTLSNADEARVRVLDYFALSPFWDIRSNNQNLRVQRTVTNRNYGSREERLELPLFKAGFEYIISHNQPPDMFVIQRRDIRPSDGSRDNVTGAWFILEGKIYPTPTLYEVMANRLKNATHMINNTFSQLSSAHPPSNPRVHSTWRSQPPNAQASSSKVQGASDSTAMDIDTPANGVTSVPDTQGASEPIATTSTAEQDEKKESGPNFRLLNALQSTKALYAESQSTAQAQSAEDDPREELRRIEAQIYGQSSGRDKPEIAPRLGAMRSISVMSGQAPKKDVNGVPSPMNKFPSIGPAGSGGARTPSMMSFVAAPSPLISQQ